MKYMLFACHDSHVEVPDDIADQAVAWSEEMDRRGVRVFGERLRPIEDASTVRVRGDEVVVSDGPFAEMKEQIGGVDILDCADLDEALEIAAKHPGARLGSVEVRPLWTR